MRSTTDCLRHNQLYMCCECLSETVAMIQTPQMKPSSARESISKRRGMFGRSHNRVGGSHRTYRRSTGSVSIINGTNGEPDWSSVDAVPSTAQRVVGCVNGRVLMRRDARRSRALRSVLGFCRRFRGLRTHGDESIYMSNFGGRATKHHLTGSGCPFPDHRNWTCILIRRQLGTY